MENETPPHEPSVQEQINDAIEKLRQQIVDGELEQSRKTLENIIQISKF